MYFHILYSCYKLCLFQKYIDCFLTITCKNFSKCNLKCNSIFKSLLYKYLISFQDSDLKYKIWRACSEGRYLLCLSCDLSMVYKISWVNEALKCISEIRDHERERGIKKQTTITSLKYCVLIYFFFSVLGFGPPWI